MLKKKGSLRSLLNERLRLMNDFNKLRSIGISSAQIRTPRTPKTSNRTQVISNSRYQQAPSNVIIVPVSDESVQPDTHIKLKQNFRDLEDTLSAVLVHNSSTVSFRNSLSDKSAEMERLFNLFYQAISKQATENLVRPSTASNSLIRQSSMSFLKNWKSYASSIFNMIEGIPSSIQQYIEL